MFPVPDRWVPGHQFFQFLVDRGLAQAGQHAQYQQQVFIGFNAVSLCRFHQGIHNGTGLRSLDTVAEQPVLSSYYEGPDGILCQIVGDGNITIVQKCTQSLLLVQGIPHRILQLAALFRVDRFQLCKILLQKGPNHILAVFFPLFGVWMPVFLLHGEQLRTVLESNRGPAGFYRGTVRHGFPPFSSGMSPATTLGDFLHLVISSISIRYQTSGKAFEEALRALTTPVRLVLKDPDMVSAVLSAGIEPHPHGSQKLLLHIHG